MCKKLTILSSVFLILFGCRIHAAELITSLNFEDGKIPNSNGWGFGAQQGGAVSISTDPAMNHRGSKGSIRGQYPITTGGMYVWGGYDVSSLNIRDVYIEFWASMPKAKQAAKFFKIFGQRDSNGYANTTFGLTGEKGKEGDILQVSFGSGTEKENDVQNVIFLTGSYPDWIGRSYAKTAAVETPQRAIWGWGDGWHRFRIHAKFNSGDSAENEVPDGQFYLEIDNKVYVDAKGLFNRHYLNKPIQRIAFFDWAQGGTEPFEILFDDIMISSGGFLSSPIPPAAKMQSN